MLWAHGNSVWAEFNIKTLAVCDEVGDAGCLWWGGRLWVFVMRWATLGVCDEVGDSGCLWWGGWLWVFVMRWATLGVCDEVGDSGCESSLEVEIIYVKENSKSGASLHPQFVTTNGWSKGHDCSQSPTMAVNFKQKITSRWWCLLGWDQN